MKPVTINLRVKKNIQDKIILVFMVVFLVAALGITLVNTLDYYANIKVIKTYELRLKKLHLRSGRKKKALSTTGEKKEYQKIKQDLDYLSTILKKNMFPLLSVLTEIERVKPEKIDINELNFSNDLMVVSIKGESNYADSVSKFIVGLDRSNRFNIELTREEINENKKIIFELTARWVLVENDKKI